MVLLEIDSKGMYDSAAEDMGKVFVSTELGGGGTNRADTVTIARRGVRNFLSHAGILRHDIQPRSTIRLDMPSSDCFVFSEAAGLVEPLVDLSHPVMAGDPVARIWPTDRTGKTPEVYNAPISGILAARHCPGLS